MSEPEDDDFSDYYRKGVPLYSPEMFLLQVLVIATSVLLVALMPWM